MTWRRLSVAAMRPLLILFGIIAVLAPNTSNAQSAGVRKIGYLSVTASPQTAYLDAFRKGLRDRGWTEGQNLIVDYRWAAGKIERVPELARELLQLNVEVLVTYGNKPPHLLKEFVKNTPIVALSCDPIETMVASLARPGGNITGLGCLSSELTPKKLELLLEIVPGARRIVLLYNPNDPGPNLAVTLARDTAARRGVEIEPVPVSNPGEFERALSLIAQRLPDALFVYPDPLMGSLIKPTVDFAAKHRLPAVYGFRQWPDAGGLMSYGSSLLDQAYRGAEYVDKVLRGAKPGELPVERPHRFELIVNTKAAKAAGLTIPASVLLRADQILD